MNNLNLDLIENDFINALKDARENLLKDIKAKKAEIKEINAKLRKMGVKE